jgi:hypothetical protein
VVLPLASVTWNVKGYVPAVFELPVMSPVEPFMSMPEGKLPEMMAQEYGGFPPAAASWQ